METYHWWQSTLRSNWDTSHERLVEPQLRIDDHNGTAQYEARDCEHESTVCVEWFPRSHGVGVRNFRVSQALNGVVQRESSRHDDEHWLLDKHLPGLGEKVRQLDRKLFFACMERPVSCSEA